LNTAPPTFSVAWYTFAFQPSGAWAAIGESPHFIMKLIVPFRHCS
jgi:hypothetical protein